MFRPEFHRHLTTRELQERHQALYLELFRTCPIVVSVPGNLIWSPNYAVGAGGIGIVSKLPPRLYLGIEPLPGNRVEFGPTKFYLPESDQFEQWEATRCNPLFLRVLERQKEPTAHQNGGGRLWCISEIPWYRGLNIDAMYASATAVAWSLFNGRINPSVVNQFKQLSSHQLGELPAFDHVFRLAWKLECIISRVLSDGYLCAASLVDSPYPVVFFRDPDPSSMLNRYRDFGLEKAASYYNMTDGMNFHFMRLNEIFQLDPEPAWPLDIALLFSGEKADSQFIYQTRSAYTNMLDEVSSFAKQNIGRYTPETFKETPVFLRLMEREVGISSGTNLYHTYRSVSVAHSLSVLKTMHDLFQLGPAETVIKPFLDAQNLCQDILRILGLTNLNLNQVQTALLTTGMRYTTTGIAARLIGPGNHGCLMVLGPENSLDRCLNETYAYLNETHQPATHCHWASWCDGNRESAGIQIEQFVAENHYSPMIRNTCVTAVEWHNGLPPEPILHTIDRWDEERAKVDLAMDEINRRIWVRGLPLSSREIHSAKQTIQLFRLLYDAGSNEIKPAALPASCYRADRNQMESKIVRPICAAVKTRTGMNLGLEVHGGLASQFTITFKPDKRLRVVLVRKE